MLPFYLLLLEKNLKKVSDPFDASDLYQYLYYKFLNRKTYLLLVKEVEIRESDNESLHHTFCHSIQRMVIQAGCEKKNLT